MLGLLKNVGLALGMLCLPLAPAWASLPPLLDRALSAEPHDIDAERLHMRVSQGETSVEFVTMPGLEDGEDHFQLRVPANEEDLDDDQRELWQRFTGTDDDAPEDGESTGSDDEDEGFGGFDGPMLRAMIGQNVEALGLRDGVQVFRFQPQTMPDASDEAPDRATRKMLEAMSGEIGVDPGRESVRFLTLSLTESVKPNMAARINSFNWHQAFSFDPVLNGPRLDMFALSVSGSAAFVAFEEELTIEIMDVRYGEADLNPDAQGPSRSDEDGSQP